MTCFECGALATENHHVIPRIYGGTKTIPLCSCCHGKVHSVRRTNISVLTKEGLRKVKERGVKLGKPENLTDAARVKAWEARRQQGRDNGNNRRALALASRMRTDGYTLRQIADELNANGYPSATGRTWCSGKVSTLLNREHLAPTNVTSP